MNRSKANTVYVVWCDSGCSPDVFATEKAAKKQADIDNRRDKHGVSNCGGAAVKACPVRRRPRAV